VKVVALWQNWAAVEIFILSTGVVLFNVITLKQGMPDGNNKLVITLTRETVRIIDSLWEQLFGTWSVW
jgi:hypothetical protein